MSGSRSVPIDYLWQIFVPDFESGSLKWRAREGGNHRITAGFNSRHAGKEALNVPDDKGYMSGTFVWNSRRISVRKHRVIWAMQTGAWPEGDIDHRNRQRSQNDVGNLRSATRSQNSQNSKRNYGISDFKGVGYHHGQWRARIFVAGKSIHLGYFASEADAARAYDRAAVQHFGEFANLNFPDERTAA